MIKWNDPDSRKTCEVLLLALGEFDPSLERPLLLKITDYVQCLDNVKELAVAILEETHVASHLVNICDCKYAPGTDHSVCLVKLHFPTNALWKPVVRSIWAPSWTGYQTELRQLRYAYNTYLKLHVALAKDWIKPFDAISESQWKCSKDGADKLRVSILTSITRVYAHLPGISADILARVVDQLDQLIGLSNSSSRNEVSPRPFCSFLLRLQVL